MKHHMMKETDTIEACPYCTNEINLANWNTEFDIHTHYGSFKCECGHKIRVEMSKIFEIMQNPDDKLNLFLNHQKETHIEKKETMNTLEGKIIIVKEYPHYTLQQGK